MKPIVSVRVDLMIESGGRRSWWVQLVNDRNQTISPSMFKESPDHDARDRALTEADVWAAFAGVEMTPYEEDGIRYEPSMEMSSYRDDDETDAAPTAGIGVMHVWKSEALKRHVPGRVVAVATDAEGARALLLAEYEAWWKSDNQYKVNDDGSWAEDEYRVEFEAAKADLVQDLSADPEIVDRLYFKGSE